jgi:hypothetical protein
MVRIALLFLALPCALALPAQAQDMRFLDWGRQFTNDALGDGQDRWRTASYGASLIFGPGWSGQLPDAPGRILEYRLRAEIIAPANLVNPAPDDRRYAGILSLGLHTHYAVRGFDVALGADVNIIGPQSGLGRVQRRLHDWVDMPDPSNALANQLPDDLRLTATVEVGRPVRLGGRAVLRPFVEGQAGMETLIRVGGDLVIGQAWEGAVMVRDPTTGQRYAALQGPGQGISVTVGADTAHVGASALLPDGGAAALRDDRHRLRLGLGWQGTKVTAFTGLTWLSPEFEGQDDGQTVGAFSINLRF